MKQDNQHRFYALDVFRGFAIAAMILVNTPGSWSFVYPSLMHADWHGLTFADIVFPFFLFAVGASMHFSFQARKATLDKALFVRVLKRSLLMFLIGWGLNVYNYLVLDLEHIRTMGVLQRISLCYFLGALIVTAWGEKGVWVSGIMILIVYPLLMVLFGGDNPFAFGDNLVAFIDQQLLGRDALWQMRGEPFDPEGLLTTMPALVSLLIGFEVTRRLMQLPRDLGAVYRLLIWGGGLFALGLALAWVIPVNKNLWTPSYVILVGGIAVLALALCVWLADLLENRLLTDPFRIFGTNPLFVYCLSWLCTATLMAIPVISAGGTVSLNTWLWQGLLPLLPPKMASLAFALLNVGFFWCVSWVLYRRNIVIKI